VTIGVNISHDSSICLKENDKLEFFEESRFNKKKYWEPTQENFDYVSFKKIKNFNDMFIFSSYGRPNNKDEKIIKEICEKYNIKNFIFNPFMHHIYHACAAFHVSSFNTALCIVIDGGGARLPKKETFQETDSIYYIDNFKVKAKYKSYSNGRYSTFWSNFYNKKKLVKLTKLVKENLSKENLFDDFFVKENCLYRMTHSYNPGLLFNHLCSTINLESNNGFKAESGKAMGLSSYGNNYGMRDEDLAKQVQEATEKYTIDLIEKALTYNRTRNIILSGGYALNCVNNYKYTQYFKNINFFIDPCPHDGGTSFGAAVWYDYYR
jgi:predicted NodU family carbamoyl transferase